MHVLKKINLKLYIPLSLLELLISFFIAKNVEEILVISGIYLATQLNFYILLKIIDKLVFVATSRDGEKYPKEWLILMFILKLGILFGSLTIGVHFIGKRILIPLLNYVFQIFILGISLNRGNKIEEK